MVKQLKYLTEEEFIFPKMERLSEIWQEKENLQKKGHTGTARHISGSTNSQKYI